jgi:hypothetical protein
LLLIVLASRDPHQNGTHTSTAQGDRTNESAESARRAAKDEPQLEDKLGKDGLGKDPSGNVQHKYLDSLSESMDGREEHDRGDKLRRELGAQEWGNKPDNASGGRPLERFADPLHDAPANSSLAKKGVVKEDVAKKDVGEADAPSKTAEPARTGRDVKARVAPPGAAYSNARDVPDTAAMQKGGGSPQVSGGAPGGPSSAAGASSVAPGNSVVAGNNAGDVRNGSVKQQVRDGERSGLGGEESNGQSGNGDRVIVVHLSVTEDVWQRQLKEAGTAGSGPGGGGIGPGGIGLGGVGQGGVGQGGVGQGGVGQGGAQRSGGEGRAVPGGTLQAGVDYGSSQAAAQTAAAQMVIATWLARESSEVSSALRINPLASEDALLLRRSEGGKLYMESPSAEAKRSGSANASRSGPLQGKDVADKATEGETIGRQNAKPGDEEAVKGKETASSKADANETDGKANAGKANSKAITGKANNGKANNGKANNGKANNEERLAAQARGSRLQLLADMDATYEHLGASGEADEKALVNYLRGQTVVQVEGAAEDVRKLVSRLHEQAEAGQAVRSLAVVPPRRVDRQLNWSALNYDADVLSLIPGTADKEATKPRSDSYSNDSPAGAATNDNQANFFRKKAQPKAARPEVANRMRGDTGGAKQPTPGDGPASGGGLPGKSSTEPVKTPPAETVPLGAPGGPPFGGGAAGKESPSKPLDERVKRGLPGVPAEEGASAPPSDAGTRQPLRAYFVVQIVPKTAALNAAIPKSAAKEDRQKATRPTKTVQLFNGKDLTGFHTWLKDTKHEDPRKVFRVTDGMLHITGDGLGYVCTDEAYRDYRLTAEFRWGKRTWADRKEKAKDSGILVHCVGPPGNYNGTWMASIEYQVIEGGVGDFILVRGKYEDGTTVPLNLTAEVAKDRDGESVWKKGGERKTFTSGRINWYGRDPDWKDVLGFRGKEDVESPDGEWTKCEVVCDGGRIQAYVNGKLVNEASDAFPSAGKILFQAELAEVFFRSIELHPLK